MGDLDSFFAKKDKKKVKGRKYDCLDEIGKRLTECEKKLEKDLVKVEPPKKTLDDIISPATTASEKEIVHESYEKKEEEWNDFVDDSEKDLSNLKISRLQIDDDDDGAGACGSDEDEAGNGEKNANLSSVWSKNVEPTEGGSSSESNSDSESPPPQTTPKTKTSYVPPHMRNMAPSPLPKGGSSRKPKVAPDITNSVAFPSLADAQSPGAPVGPWGKRRDMYREDNRGFDLVKHGASPAQRPDMGPSKVSTANRFDALRES